jgi:tetratricopeptide (TPR) repeat protein
MAALPHAPRDDSRLQLQLAYSGLTAAAARVFRLLPAHPGPDVSAAAAAALADLPASDARSALECLALAQLAEPVPGSGERWRLDSPAREYALRLSDADGAGDAGERATDRLTEYYLLTTEAADDLLRGEPAIPPPEEFDDRDGALAWLDAEWPSLVTMVRMAADTGREQAAASLPLLMAQYLGFRGRFDELTDITTIGLSAARLLGDHSAEGEALTNLGLALSGMRRFEQAVGAHQDAVAIFRQIGDRQDEGAARNNLGIALHGLGRNDEAARAHREATAIFREMRDRLGEGRAVNNLGLALRGLNQNNEAVLAHQEAATIFHEAGRDHEEAMALANSGNALNEAGLRDQANAAYQRAADIFRETGDYRSELMARQNLQLSREMS